MSIESCRDFVIYRITYDKPQCIGTNCLAIGDFKAYVVNYEGPYEDLVWQWTTTEGTILAEDNNHYVIGVNGDNEIKTITITVSVTDANETVSKSFDVDFEFESATP